VKFEKLQTERLTIRRLHSADAEAFARYRSLPEISRFQSAYSVAGAQALIRDLSTSDPSVPGRWFQFAIEHTHDARLIGDIGFFNTDENHKSWIGFTLDPETWHKGYAAEALRAVLTYCRKIGVSTFWASTDPTNHSSMKLLNTLGFKLVDSKPDDMIFFLED
jgi:aminoglycoside 6'-N-acetyltransferase